MNDIALSMAQNEIKLPERSSSKSKWFVECKINHMWQIITFDLQEDAWSFYYSKLGAIKKRITKQLKERQK